MIRPLFCKHNPTAMLRGLPGGQIGVRATSQKVPVISGQETIYGVYQNSGSKNKEHLQEHGTWCLTLD